MAERIIVSAEAARETDKATIKQAQAVLRETHADQMRAIGAIRAKDQQRWHMIYTGLGAALAVSLLWLFYPGWAAGLAPSGWSWPERVATRTMGEPSLWEAGIRLMRTGNPEGWQAIVDATDLVRNNRRPIAACAKAAKKAAEPIRCETRLVATYLSGSLREAKEEPDARNRQSRIAERITILLANNTELNS
ncbi:DUF6118 family protein [Sphingobium yanoikuyae]